VQGIEIGLGRIEKTVLIQAPLERVWELLVDVENYPAYCSFIKEGRVTYHPRGEKSCDMEGVRTRMVFDMAGITREVEAVEAEYVHHQRFVRKGVSGMRFEASAVTSTTPEGTLLKCHMDYDLPYGILGKIMDSVFFGAEMERNIERSLDNIKAALEGRKRLWTPAGKLQQDNEDRGGAESFSQSLHR
jgi:uncharacterized membrane protein